MTTNKRIPAILFSNPEEFTITRWCAVVPPDITFEDLLQPHAWAHFSGPPPSREYPRGQGKFQLHDIVRVIAEEGEFDLDLVVTDVNVGSVTMKVRPFFGEASGDAAVTEALKIAGTKPGIVPLGRDNKPVVYVDHTPATGWRLVNESGTVSDKYPTRAAAEKAMAQYLKKAHLVLPELEPDTVKKDEKPAAKSAA